MSNFVSTLSQGYNLVTIVTRYMQICKLFSERIVCLTAQFVGALCMTRLYDARLDLGVPTQCPNFKLTQSQLFFLVGSRNDIISGRAYSIVVAKSRVMHKAPGMGTVPCYQNCPLI